MKKFIVKKSLLVLAASLAAIAPAFVQKQTPPEGSAPKSFMVPASETYVLPSGLRVTLVPYGVIPKAAVSLAVEAGSLNEGKSHAGVASLTGDRSEEHTSELQSRLHLVCRLLLEKKNMRETIRTTTPRPCIITGASTPSLHLLGAVFACGVEVAVWRTQRCSQENVIMLCCTHSQL